MNKKDWTRCLASDGRPLDGGHHFNRRDPLYKSNIHMCACLCSDFPFLLFHFYFFSPVAFLHTSMGWNQEKRARGGHFLSSVFAFLQAVCGCSLQYSGSRDSAPPLNCSTASSCLTWIYSGLYIFGGLDVALLENKSCEAARALNDPSFEPRWDTWDDFRNHPVTYFGKGKKKR